MRKRALAFFVALIMLFGLFPVSPAFATAHTTLLAIRADGFTSDNALTESFWAATASVDGGSVAAAWDKTNLYLGIAAVGSTKASATLGSKTVEVTPSADGIAEMQIPWSEAGVTLRDYGQVVSGLSVSITGAGSDSTLNADVKITSMTANRVDFTQMGVLPSGTTGITVEASKASWDTTAAGQNRLWKQNYSFVDHTKDILISQTLKVEDLPVGDGKYTNDQTADDCYFFWVSDIKAANNNTNPNGTGFLCTIYRADTEGNLYIRVYHTDKDTSNAAEGVALGKKLGDAFKLGVLWGADGSADILVDGKTVSHMENGTTTKTNSMGSKCIQIWYNGSAEGGHAKFTVSDFVLNTAGAASVTDAITKSAVLGDADLTAVTEDITLPATFTDSVFGDIPLTWNSSIPAMLGNDGKVTRPAGDQSKTATLTLSVYDKELWSVEVTVLPAAVPENAKTLTAVRAENIVADNKLNEAFWAATGYVEGKPSGSVAAAWDSEKLYLGITAKDAASVKVVLGTKTVETALSADGIAELQIPWSEAGVTLRDFGQLVGGLTITLLGTNESSALNAVVKITSMTANRVDFTQMGVLPSGTTGITVEASKASWDTTAAGQNRLWKQNYSFVDHTKDILISQTLKVEDLPVGDGKYTNDQTADDCYFFWVSDIKAANNNTNPNGTGFLCTIYRADTEGNLYIRVYHTDKDTSNAAEGVALGKKLGDAFKLGVLWGADGSADILVDGKTVSHMENGTTTKTNSMGSKCIQIWYNGSAEGGHAKFTVSDFVLNTAGAASVTDAITKSAVLGDADLTAVTEDITLPATFTDSVFGDIPLTWNSSDTSILANDGTVTRPTGTGSKTATLTLSVYDKELWSVDVTVLPASASRGIKASCADEITVDGELNEKFYIHTETISASGTGKPSGKVYAVYNKNGVYFGVEHRDADKLTINLGGKACSVKLSDGAVTGIGSAAVSTGKAEVMLPWSELNVTLADYYQEIPGFQVSLENSTGTSALLDEACNLVPTGERLNDVAVNKMSRLNASGLNVNATDAVWDTENKTVTGLYQLGFSFIDHTKDITLIQTLKIEVLPVSTGNFSNDQTADDCYYFWLSDVPATSNANADGTALFCAIYKADDEGNLKLKICGDRQTANSSEGVILGKKLGDTFRLRIEWLANNSALVYVDGELVHTEANATWTKNQYMGKKCIQMRHNATTAGNRVQFTVSDFAVAVASVASVRDEMTVQALLPGVDLSNVQADIALPTVFNSPYLGNIPVRWESSDNDVINSATGEVTKPDSDESVTVKLSAFSGDKILWTVDATVPPAPAEELGPYKPSPKVITVAHASGSIVIDGKPGEYGWALSTRVLDGDGMAKGKFGVQWDKDNLYVAAKVRGSSEMTLTLGEKTATINLSTLAVTGDYTVSSIAKKNAYIELAIPMTGLGVEVDRYNYTLPVTVALGENEFSGTLKLTSIDWFAADNEYRPIPAPLKNSVKTGNDAPVSSYQGYEQVADGWRMFDLYNAEGANPALVRTYVIFINDELYAPFADRTRTTFVEFDFQADALPVYDVTSNIGLSTHFASYGMTWFISDEADGSKNSNSLSLGILNTESGLALAALPESGIPSLVYLNKQVGELFRVGTAWKTNGDVVLYIDGVETAVLRGLECTRNSFGNNCAAFNLIRNGSPAAGTEDNMDVTLTNIAMGHSYDDEPLDQLTFASFAGTNVKESAVTSNLVLPAEIKDPILSKGYAVTWTSSQPGVIAVDGTVTRPQTGTATVKLTAALADGSEKSFEFTVLGVSSGSGDVLVVNKDYTPATGAGVASTEYLFTLDTENNSVIVDLGEKKTVNVAELHDGDSFARLNESVLTLWVSDDNVSYTQVEGFKLLHNGDTWYLYDFEAEGRYVKVHCTHYDGKDADFIAPTAGIVTAKYESVFGGGSGSFSVSKTYTLTNNADEERFDWAWSIPKAELGVSGTDASIRVFLGDELLYHYVDGDNVVVRVPYLGTGASVALKILSGNDGAMDISNKEYVHEVSYGTREAWTISDGAHWMLKLDNGDILILGGNNSMIWRAFSYDGGRTWTERETIACTENFITEGGGFIVNSDTGRIMFHGHKVVSWNAGNMALSDCKTNIIYSDDNGRTWAKLGTVTTDSTYALSYTDGIQLSTYDGEGPNVDFVFPLGAQYNNSGSFCARVAYSTDGGMTWQTSETKILYLEGTAFESGVSECTIQERADGTLVLIGRNQASGTDHFAQSYSYDHGITWQSPASLSTVYSVNTQPIMFIYKDKPILTWGGNNMLGDASYIRAPYSIGVSEDGMESFRNIQDLYSGYSLQGLTYFTQNRITNQSVQVTDDDTLLTLWWNSTKGGAVRNTVLMRVEDFYDYFYRTKGAYDSFKSGSVKYEGWETTMGTASVSDALASDGDYSMALDTAIATRSIPYLQNGSVSLDLYVNGSSEFSVELQSAYANVYGKGAPLGFKVKDNVITLLGSETSSGITLQNGWNTVRLELDLDSESPSAEFFVNGTSRGAVPVNTEIGDYVTFITVMNTGLLYVDNVLVVDYQAAAERGELTETVSVTAESTNLHADGEPASTKVTANVTATDGTAPSVTWVSSDESVVTVTSDGGLTAMVTAVGNGTATITAISNDGSGASGNITLTVSPAGGSYVPPVVVVTPPEEEKDETPTIADFTDLDENAWYREGVEYVLENGLMKGVGDDKFLPDGTADRAMLATIIWRLDGEQEVDFELTFEDVEPDTWYTEAVRWAASEKVVNGYSDLKFGLFDPITREQLAVMLYRYASIKGIEVNEDANLSDYLDSGDISDWALPAMKWAVETGIIKGVGGGKLAPKNTATRAEAATMLKRYAALNK